MKKFRVCFLIVWILMLAAMSLRAQIGEYTYQGSLNLSGTPANGIYDFEFVLYDVLNGGNPIAFEVRQSGVNVTNGIFNVNLFFITLPVLPAGTTYLEVRVRPSGGGAYTVLTPRQLLRSVPYANRAVHANTASSLNCSNCVSSDEISSVNGSSVQGTIPVASVPAGSLNYVQNGISQQAGTNFNISGTGSAQLFNAQAQFNIVGNRVLSLPNSTTNTALGINANVNSGVTNGTAIGNGAVATASNSVVLGRTVDRVIAPGSMIIGNRTTGRGELSIYPSGTNADLYLEALDTTRGINLAGAKNVSSTDLVISHFDGIKHDEIATFRSSRIMFRTSLDVDGVIFFQPDKLGANLNLCVSGLNTIAFCSSSIRYKSNLNDFSGGFDLLRRLRPVSFNWKQDGKADLGLVAEEVAAIDPLLVTYNDKGEVEGVKYDRIGVVLINTVKEQQSRIEKLESELAVLKKLIADKFKEEKR